MSSNNRDRLDAGASAAARAAPAVRSLAKKLGVDLEKCVGTGRDGTITMNDVIARTNQAKNKAAPVRQMPSQPSRRGPEPVSAAPAPTPARPASGPLNTPAPNQPSGWMSELEGAEPDAQSETPAAAWEPTPVAQPRVPPKMQPTVQRPVPPSARSWATMEEDLPAEEPAEQPGQSEPRMVASRLQDLSSYDFPSAERQPTEPQNDAYAQPRMSWFTTEESDSQETVASYGEPAMQPDPTPAEPLRALNPWGAVEVEEQEAQSDEQSSDDAPQATQIDVSEAIQVEEYVELVSDEPADTEPAMEDQEGEQDWEARAAAEDLAPEALADDLTPYESEAEAEDAAVMTTVYEAPASQAAARSDLGMAQDWAKLAPETPAEWAQPGLANVGAEARVVPLRTPYLDMTPRTLVDQEDRLHGQRRNMALNMTRARDEVATCTMFDDADLNAWPSYTDITVRLLRAIVAGIHVEPGFNATFDPAGPSRRLLRQINVAVSVDTREGLTVPVLRDVGSRSLEELREYVYHMKERTLTRSLSPEDLRDFSFSLANYGIFAGRYATPPVVPPAVATLGCGRLERAVVAGENAPEIHAMLPLSLSFDHRCVTMGEACRFLAALKQDLELPQ